MRLHHTGYQFPASYTYGMFRQLRFIVASKRQGSVVVNRIASRMTSVHQLIEYIFAFHYNLSDLFAQHFLKLFGALD